MKLFNIFQELGLSIPFILMAGQDAPRLNWTRIIEAAMIAIAGGLLAGYISVQKLEVEFKYLAQNSMVKNGEQDTRLNDICQDVGKLKERMAILEATHLR